jgi:D-sedoheptulose 7-phosphate isomerase
VLTAQTNDEGWETTFAACPPVSKLNRDHALLILSVGGGDVERGVTKLVRALEFGWSVGTRFYGAVGHDGAPRPGTPTAASLSRRISPTTSTPYRGSMAGDLCSHPFPVKTARRDEWRRVRDDAGPPGSRSEAVLIHLTRPPPEGDRHSPTSVALCGDAHRRHP